MNICFRVDSSSQLGTGHVMRCLTLAEELNENGATVTFICRALSGDLTSYIRQKGYVVHRTQTLPYDSGAPLDSIIDAENTIKIVNEMNDPVDWLIIDHYQIDFKWELRLRPYARKILVIDDLADRKHVCDILLDQNFYYRSDERYKDLIPPDCVKLLGPSYALLRKEFVDERRKLQHRNGKVQNMFVFFGGSDPTGETEKVLKALQFIDLNQYTINVVVGSSNPRQQLIEQICRSMKNVRYHCQISYMASLMSSADLSIGAGGTATWERMYLGLPTVTIIIADNQEETTEALSEEGLIWNLGRSESVTVEMIIKKIQNIINDPILLQNMERNALSFMNIDSEEGFSYVTKVMLKESGYVE